MRNNGSFPHCLDADSFSGISTSFSTTQLWETAVSTTTCTGEARTTCQNRDIDHLHEYCKCGISTVFSTLGNCGIGLSSHDGHLENCTTCKQGNRPPCQRTAAEQPRACRQPCRVTGREGREPDQHNRDGDHLVHTLRSPNRRDVNNHVQELHLDSAQEPTLRLAGRPRRM